MFMWNVRSLAWSAVCFWIKRSSSQSRYTAVSTACTPRCYVTRRLIQTRTEESTPSAPFLFPHHRFETSSPINSAVCSASHRFLFHSETKAVSLRPMIGLSGLRRCITQPCGNAAELEFHLEGAASAEVGALNRQIRQEYFRREATWMFPAVSGSHVHTHTLKCFRFCYLSSKKRKRKRSFNLELQLLE